MLHLREATFNYTAPPNIHLALFCHNFPILRQFIKHEIKPRFREWYLPFRNITDNFHTPTVVYNISCRQFMDEVINQRMRRIDNGDNKGDFDVCRNI